MIMFRPEDKKAEQILMVVKASYMQEMTTSEIKKMIKQIRGLTLDKWFYEEARRQLKELWPEISFQGGKMHFPKSGFIPRDKTNHH